MEVPTFILKKIRIYLREEREKEERNERKKVCLNFSCWEELGEAYNPLRAHDKL